ncbi:MAG: hypothetical protein H7A23_08425 [Leptospiraceae bacterium]|nr:hypothetical protein [Leptospiraceae bacterium]MCP5494571.1 hypothetical protein [Leptospiraceae bacterium]
MSGTNYARLELERKRKEELQRKMEEERRKREEELRRKLEKCNNERDRLIARVETLVEQGTFRWISPESEEEVKDQLIKIKNLIEQKNVQRAEELLTTLNQRLEKDVPIAEDRRNQETERKAKTIPLIEELKKMGYGTSEESIKGNFEEPGKPFSRYKITAVKKNNSGEIEIVIPLESDDDLIFKIEDSEQTGKQGNCLVDILNLINDLREKGLYLKFNDDSWTRFSAERLAEYKDKLPKDIPQDLMEQIEKFKTNESTGTGRYK